MKRLETKFLLALLLPFTLILGGGIWGGTAQHTHRSADQGGVISWIPTGFIGCYAGSTPPTNTLEAYGQAVSRVTYPNLFSQIGTTHGAGDGVTTFNLPDIRGRVMIGMDNMGGSAANRITAASLNGGNAATLGGTGGLQTHTLTNAEAGTLNTFGIAQINNPGGDFDPVTSRNAPTAHSNTQPWISLKCVIGT